MILIDIKTADILLTGQFEQNYIVFRQSKLAGVLLLGVGGLIPPKSQTHMETACQITEDKTIHPFAYRTHTHSLGKTMISF